MEGLGILPEVRRELIEELDIIINSAASVSFHEHLRDAIQINYNGAVRMMALAHECKKLKILSHVSTAFVGSNLPPNSLIEEAIQKETHKEDFEIQIKHILEMDHETIAKSTTQLINGYKNTYTYTKNLAERYLERYRGNLRVVINRPTMVYNCCREPIPGWFDQVGALGMVSFPVGMGFTRSVFLPNVVLDFIPGDICSNSILVSTAYVALLPKPDFRIFHNSIST